MSKSSSNTVIPETFPFILKTYAKDVMRTQPYDLLSWSAAYFRCFANGIQPPTKLQFEESTEKMIESRSLTKEYLKILVKQIGKGFFVERVILQQRWKALGLPQNDLLAYLNVCGMFDWERVHWLELLSAMAASLCESFEASIDLLCRILTEDDTGGLNSIPVWMFSTCYLFLAQLNNGAEKDTNIDDATPSIEPLQIRANTFRTELLVEWKSCVGFPNNQNDTTASEHFDRIKKSVTFAEIIQALSDIQSDANGEDEIDDIKVTDSKWKYEIIRRIGAPWNWIYQFVDHHAPGTKSYNFYECEHKLESIGHLEEMDEPLPFTHLNLTWTKSAIPAEVTNEFLNFANAKAIENDGLFSPNLFTDEKCPRFY